jgi:hypothetical protein
MKAVHKPDAEMGFSDDQMVEHLLSSECSECVAAGYRFGAMLREYKELREVWRNDHKQR